MELGEKLRQARLEAGLSQRKLCGSAITRNMLSQIENGSARPSMDTLRYLAGVLGKPMGYFLEETSAEENPMDAVRKAYRMGEYAVASDILNQNPQEEGDEAGLLRLLSLIALAEQAIEEKRFPYARQLLESAAEAEEKTMYASAWHRQQRLILLSKASSGSVAEFVSQLPSDDEALLLRARAALERGDLSACGNYLSACEDREDALWNLVSGEMHFKNKDFAQAAACYKAAEESFPEACIGPLEQCYLSLEDYKQAYEYARKGRKEGSSC